MESSCARDLIARRYRQAYDAADVAGFPDYLYSPGGAALGYRRAHAGPLFLEAYLDHPVEQLVGARLTRTVAREQIVEIGNLAAENALAMIDLWSAAANDLAGASEVAVATLTLPLRRSFARIGIALHDLGPADPARLATSRRPVGPLLRPRSARLRRRDRAGTDGRSRPSWRGAAAGRRHERVDRGDCGPSRYRWSWRDRDRPGQRGGVVLRGLR